MKKCISDLKDSELRGRRALVRVDFNVPLDTERRIADDRRIRESLPTINYLSSKGAKTILISHLGRPRGITEELRLNPVAQRLSELMNRKILKLDDCIGKEVEDELSKLNNGDVALLENVRFYKEEEENDENFSKKLASLGDLYVNDAFGTAHRAHASTEGIAHFLPGVCGFLIKKELEIMGQALLDPKRPFLAIIGGAKVSSKIGVIKNLAEKVDSLIIGGGMIYTFLKAQGFEIGKSLVEEKYLDEAKIIWAHLKSKPNFKFITPVDIVVANELSQNAETNIVGIENIPKEMMGLDMGPKTIELFKQAIKSSKTIIWNGPVGVFEISKFANGTNEIAKALAQSSAVTIVGGGDSASAVEKAGYADKMTHISTGGGASLEFMEGKDLPGISVLMENR